MPDDFTPSPDIQEPIEPQGLTPDALAPQEPQDAPVDTGEPQEPVEPQEPQKTPYQKRIDELTRKYREEERRRLALEERLGYIEQQVSRPRQDPQAVLVSLKSQRKEAAAALDLATAYEIDDRIRAIETDIAFTRQQELLTGSTRQASQQQVLESFQRTTDWFNQSKAEFNKPMAVYAAHLENELARSWSGTYYDLLDEVKRQTEETFGYKRAGGTPAPVKQPVSYVQGVGHQTVPQQKPVTLTDDERRAAHIYFGDSPDAEKTYAEEKARLARRR